MIIPTWEKYTDRLLKDMATAPYQSSIFVDSAFEEGAFQGVKLADGSVTDVKIAGLSANKITTGTLSASIGIGTGRVLIDGENKRIIINDGTRDIILIGYQAGGF